MKPTTVHEANDKKYRMRLNLAILFGVTAFLVSVLTLYIAGSNSTKVGFVRSSELIYGYAGMKEAQNLFKSKSQTWQANIDTLRSDYRNALNRYNTDFNSLSAGERKQREELLKKQENNLVQYSDAIQKKALEEEQEMTEGVLNQINSFVEQYGQDHGFDMIYGTTSDGNILFADLAYDLTDEILDDLNKSYKQ